MKIRKTILAILLFFALSSPAFSAQVKATALGSGYYRVSMDGQEISKHTTERGAFETATNLILANPTAKVSYAHDYTVLVESDISPTLIPEPSPSPAFSLYAQNSVWNKKLSTEAIHNNSPGLVAELSENQKIAGTWIETGPFATPIYFVKGNSLQKVKVYLKGDTVSPNAIELAKGVPIPVSALPATGTDGHLCIIDTDNQKEYNFWQAKKQADGSFLATNAGILPNLSTSDGTMELRTNGWNSATATHLPLAGGTILLSELRAGVIPHAIATSINRPAKNLVVWPAKTTDGWYTGPNAIPEGQRFRFPANITIDPNWQPITKMLVTAIRDYGMVVKDKTGAGVGFGLEDMRQHGITDTGAELKKYMGGKNIWDVLGTGKEFPWNKLEALA